MFKYFRNIPNNGKQLDLFLLLPKMLNQWWNVYNILIVNFNYKSWITAEVVDQKQTKIQVYICLITIIILKIITLYKVNLFSTHVIDPLLWRKFALVQKNIQVFIFQNSNESLCWTDLLSYQLFLKKYVQKPT